MERCCRCLRFALRLIGRQSAHLLQPLVVQMVQLYAVHHHSCFLYLASILVDEYGSENDCIDGLMYMLEALLPHAFKLLQEQGFCNHPDTADDLFRLFTRFLQRSPASFLQSLELPSILDCAIQACSLDHRDANSSVMQFLTELIHTARIREEKVASELREKLMKNILLPKGPLIIKTLITASVFSLSTCSLPHVGGVLLEFMTVDKQSVAGWLELTLENLPRQSASGCVAVRPDQLQNFKQQIIGCDGACELSQALRDFSRLYR